MKKKVLAAFMIIAVAFPAFSQKQMSRAEVLKFAFENSNDLAQLKAERQRIEFMRREYFGKAFPDINGAVNYLLAPDLNDEVPAGPSATQVLGTVPDANIADNTLAGYLDEAMAGLGEAMSAMNSKNTLQWEVSASQIIFAQGKVRTGLKIAEISLQMLDDQYKDAQFSLAQTIINAYNGVLMAQQALVIQQDALIIAEESHRLTLAKFNSGNGSALDTLNTRYNIQAAILRLRDAEKSQRLAIKSLANAASIKDVDFSLSDSLVIPDFNMSEDAAWEEMQKNNTTLKLLAEQKTLQQKQTHLVKSDYLPILGASASIGQVNLFEDVDGFSGDGWKWRTQIGVGLQVPIINGGQRRSKVHQAKLEELKLEKQEMTVTDGLRLALSAAFEDLAIAKEEMSQSEQMLILAEQGFKISKLSFELGQLTQLELNNAEQNFRMAKLAQYSAILHINSAVVNIEKLIGNENLITLGN